ncbi:IS30 family transposase [Streptomyces sp. NPDC053431]|uniref:IS30 family transposase n=1 Tax=Streptomyces sp. NPDC053431 TaxID=3365703 RepID=UPI0037D32B6C
MPPQLRRTLTWDRGREIAEHQAITAETGMPIYLCEPRSPWRRGTNEDTNRLLRQYLPKGADLRTSQAMPSAPGNRHHRSGSIPYDRSVEAVFPDA